MARLALVIIASTIPLDSMMGYFYIQRRLLPHCDRVYSLLQRKTSNIFFQEENSSLSSSFHMLGDLYLYQSKMEEAELMYLRTISGQEKALGPDYIARR